MNERLSSEINFLTYINAVIIVIVIIILFEFRNMNLSINNKSLPSKLLTSAR